MVAVLLLSLTAITACKKIKIDDVAIESLTEECIAFNAEDVMLNLDATPSIVYGSTVLDYYPNETEARQALQRIKYYGYDEKCTCADGTFTDESGAELDPRGMVYYLKDGQAITGSAIEEEDCLPFNPEKLVAKKLGNNWTIVERPGHLMFAFGNDKAACTNALAVIKKHGFTESCFVGRPMASMQYLKGDNIEASGTAPNLASLPLVSGTSSGGATSPNSNPTITTKQ